MVKKFNPSVGRDFDLDVNIEVMKEKRRQLKDWRRYTIAIGVLTAIAIGVAWLGYFGLHSGNFSPLVGFWNAAGPIFGAIIGYYFGKDGDDG